MIQATTYNINFVLAIASHVAYQLIK